MNTVHIFGTKKGTVYTQQVTLFFFFFLNESFGRKIEEHKKGLNIPDTFLTVENHFSFGTIGA